MIEPYTDKIKTNIKKAKGQLDLINKMIENDKYCVDIAQQINACVGLLKQANAYILESHLLSCGTHKLSSKDVEEKMAFVKELIKAFRMNNK